MAFPDGQAVAARQVPGQNCPPLCFPFERKHPVLVPWLHTEKGGVRGGPEVVQSHPLFTAFYGVE